MGRDKKRRTGPNKKRFSLAKRPPIKEQGNAAQPNKETSLRIRHSHFAEIDGHNC
jgi:hypothetical protein